MKTLALALLLTAVAAADERYVPLTARTEVEIANPSARRTTLRLELLGGAPAYFELAAGERMQWTAPAAGVLRISGDGSVTAVHHRDGVKASLPVLHARDGVEEATIAARPPWRSGLLLVNPRDVSTVVTMDGAVHVLPPHGVLRGTAFRAETPLLAFAHDVHEGTGAEVFTAITLHARTLKRRAVRSITPQPQSQTLSLLPSKDNTLFETPNGETSNGAGPHVFAGTTQGRTRRRAVLAFDIAGQLPPGSRIVKATLTLRVSQTITGAEPIALHRLNRNWGEGTSNAGSSRDGGGTASTPNDATWQHTFFPNQRWTNAGGDFDAAADATASVATTTGVWESAAMTARVQQWLDQPATNFGWIVIGDEASSGTAKRFDSREAQGASRPSLTIELQR
ncbi:MAG TPA: DNRLRE domain-containing protein [Thermoanaerobaculia bacterium]|nr:DNRLRE domain-containing protein [Thermoanaerobaculia bacterium]